MKLTGISLSVIALSSLMVVSTYCAHDPLLNRVYSEETRNTIARGLLVGATCSAFDMGLAKIASQIDPTTLRNAGTLSKLTLVVAAQPKSNDGDFKLAVMQFLSVCTGYIATHGVVIALDMLKAQAPSQSSK